MISNFRFFRKKRFLRSTNILPFGVIITGLGAVAINFLNLGIIELTAPQTIIIALLVLLGFDAVIEHSKEFEDIKSGIEDLKKELKKEKGYEFTTDTEKIWGIAIEMLKEVGESGRIYDSSSIKNKDPYEETIEKKCKEGIEVTRLITSSNHQKSVKDFINPPTRKCKKAKCISIYHLPYSLPFDLLITRNREEVRAIIGFKTSNSDDAKYKLALSIYDIHIATQIENVFESVLNTAEKHTGKIKGAPNHSCSICKDILKE